MLTPATGVKASLPAPNPSEGAGPTVPVPGTPVCQQGILSCVSFTSGADAYRKTLLS